MVCSLLVGCGEEEEIVRVRPDGSGTIEFRSLRLHSSKAAIDEILAEFKLPGDKASKAPLREEERADVDLEYLLSDYYQNIKAKEYGADVRVSSVAPYSTEHGVGYQAVYSFDDISKIEVGSDKLVAQSHRAKPITFSSARDKPGELTVNIPLRDLLERFAAPPRVPAEPEPDRKFQNLIERAFKGMKARTVLIPEGQIISTDASHRDGGTIILRSFEWDKISDNRPLLDFLFNEKRKTLEQAYAFYSRAPGHRYELKPEISVKWK